MGFQLVNNDDAASKSINSNLQEEEMSPEYFNAPYIADHYQKTEPPNKPSDIRSATILSQNNSFVPILMYIGAGFYIIALIYAFIALSSGHHMNSVWITMIKLLNIGGIFCIVDAIIMVCKKCGGWSLVLWAWWLPPVYWLKRFEENGDSQLIPLIIIGVVVLLVILVVVASISV